MTREETKALMAKIRNIYPQFCAKTPEHELPQVVNLWAKVLQDYPAAYVEHGLYFHMEQSPYAPTIADLLQAAQATKNTGFLQGNAFCDIPSSV